MPPERCPNWLVCGVAKCMHSLKKEKKKEKRMLFKVAVDSLSIQYSERVFYKIMFA